jgi:tripartite-type tricarboxylate transporter receptor subunit TctC
MTITRRLGVLGGLSLAASAAFADTGQQITMLVGAPQGSGIDQVARDFAACLQSHLDTHEIAVRNVPGEAGYRMLVALAGAPRGDATIGWVSTPTLPARMIDHNDASQIRRLRLLGMVEREPVAFVSPVGDPINSVQDLINRAGEDADAVPLGTPPAGSPPHLAAVRLQGLAQTRLNIVTFPSAAAASQAVLAANVSAAALGLSSVIDDLRDGRLSAIGIASGRRFGMLPDIPVLDEAGFPLAAVIGRGLAAPVGMPSALVDALVTAMRAVTDDEVMRPRAEANGYHLVWGDGPTWLAQMQAEQALLSKLWLTDPWLSSSAG